MPADSLSALLKPSPACLISKSALTRLTVRRKLYQAGQHLSLVLVRLNVFCQHKRRSLLSSRVVSGGELDRLCDDAPNVSLIGKIFIDSWRIIEPQKVLSMHLDQVDRGILFCDIFGHLKDAKRPEAGLFYFEMARLWERFNQFSEVHNLLPVEIIVIG